MNEPAGGFLTTHVLDTALGLPAEGIEVSLYRIDGNQRVHLTTRVTNSDGRTDAPILPVETFATGTYELEFHVGAYHLRMGQDLSEPAFLDIVPIRFGIADATSHYHVPLLVSPYGFSTYRGS